MIRKATHKDLDAIVELAVTSVMINPLPVRIDRGSMKDMARECLGGNHFSWVSEIDGQVVGAVSALTQPSFWFERKSCSVLLYYSERPGETIKLLRRLARWIKARPVIKTAILEMEPDADPRMVDMLRRLGFDRMSTNMCYVRSPMQ